MNLSEIRTQVRQRADIENSLHIKDDELTNYINASYAELYDLLVSVYEDYFVKQIQFVLSGGVSKYTLPADFYKVRGLDYGVTLPNDWISIRRFNFSERNTRNRVTNRLIYGLRRIMYRLVQNEIIIVPDDQADGTYRLWYIPRFVPLVLETDEVGDVLDFQEYIIIDAAIKCVIKEESDPQALLLTKQQMKDRILCMAANRSDEPERIADVSVQNNALEYLFPR